MNLESHVAQNDAFDWLGSFDESTAHCAVVDYPWTFSNQDRAGRANEPRQHDWDMEPNEELAKALKLVKRATVDGGWIFIFADDGVYPKFREATERVLTYRKTLIWDCERMGMGHYFRSEHAYVIAATNGDTDRTVNDVGSVFKAPATQRQPGETTEYPTEKPAKLYRQLIDPVTRPGEKIIEPFCGSAPGLDAARSLSLSYAGCDVADEAIRRAKERRGQQTLY